MRKFAAGCDADPHPDVGDIARGAVVVPELIAADAAAKDAPAVLVAGVAAVVAATAVGLLPGAAVAVPDSVVAGAVAGHAVVAGPDFSAVPVAPVLAVGDSALPAVAAPHVVVGPVAAAFLASGAPVGRAPVVVCSVLLAAAARRRVAFVVPQLVVSDVLVGPASVAAAADFDFPAVAVRRAVAAELVALSAVVAPFLAAGGSVPVAAVVARHVVVAVLDRSGAVVAGAPVLAGSGPAYVPPVLVFLPAWLAFLLEDAFRPVDLVVVNKPMLLPPRLLMRRPM